MRIVINKIKIIDTLRKLNIEAGYLEVLSPTLEFYDVFSGRRRIYRTGKNVISCSIMQEEYWY